MPALCRQVRSRRPLNVAHLATLALIGPDRASVATGRTCFGASAAPFVVLRRRFNGMGRIGEADEEAEAAILRSLIVPISAVRRMTTPCGPHRMPLSLCDRLLPEVLVEIVAHVSVMFLSEVLGVHQKQMGCSAE